MRSRLSALIRKEFIQILRDKRTLAISLAMPVLMLFLLGYVATYDVKNISLAILDQDNSPASRALLEAYRAADYFRADFQVGSEEQIRALIDSGAARAGLIIPPDYGEKLAAGGSAEIAFFIDGSDPTVASTALSAATLIGQAHATRITLSRLEARGMSGAVQPPLDVRTQIWYNPSLKSVNYMVPALIGMILQFLTTMLTSTAIVRERERGTIEQLIVTPIRSWELVIGKLVPYVIIAFVDALEVLCVGALVFNVPMNGSLALLLALACLFLITTLGMGLLISTLANTQQEAMLTTLFTVYPSIFLSGFLFPLAAMPAFLQALSYLIPLRYFLTVTRGILLKGVGMEALWPEVLALTIFAVVMMGAAALRFKKRLD
ncbi:MAG TPA: ABC transporter permease [Anaerolineaceae bacterium]|nr:ABC transporter permease [Anaerolineaceae bacterium]